MYVSADVAFAVLLAASVFTHALRGTFYTLCTPSVNTVLLFCSSVSLVEK
jgi:hypothetical protein